MKAIYIGYSKCGTKTMNSVFTALGYKCYDVMENYGYLGDEWTKILTQGATPEDFKRMYADVDSCSDIPAYIFWEEILAAFPDVKLLVGYREEESWIKSFKNQMTAIQNNQSAKVLSMLSPTHQRILRVGRLFSYHIWGGDRNAWPWQLYLGINYQLMRHRYRKYNLYIQEMINFYARKKFRKKSLRKEIFTPLYKERAPKDQLHVVDFKEGWGPICEFLGEPVPDKPFPHANKGATVLEDLMDEHPIFKKIKREAIITATILAMLTAVGICYLLRCFYLTG